MNSSKALSYIYIYIYNDYLICRNFNNVDYVDDKERTMRMQKRAARFQDMLGEDDTPAGGGKKQRTQKLSLQINEVLVSPALKYSN